MVVLLRSYLTVALILTLPCIIFQEYHLLSAQVYDRQCLLSIHFVRQRPLTR